MCVVFTANYFFSKRRCSCQQRGALSDQLRVSYRLSLSEVHIGIRYVCMYSYERMSIYMYKYLYCVSNKIEVRSSQTTMTLKAS
jgi:hypothetical protein